MIHTVIDIIIIIIIRLIVICSNCISIHSVGDYYYYETGSYGRYLTQWTTATFDFIMITMITITQSSPKKLISE